MIFENKLIKIEYEKVFDTMVAKILWQNEKELPRGNFEYQESIASREKPYYEPVRKKLYIQGVNKKADNNSFIIPEEELNKFIEMFKGIEMGMELIKTCKAISEQENKPEESVEVYIQIKKKDEKLCEIVFKNAATYQVSELLASCGDYIEALLMNDDE